MPLPAIPLMESVKVFIDTTIRTVVSTENPLAIMVTDSSIKILALPLSSKSVEKITSWQSM